MSFFTKEAADLAISTFDDQLQLQVGAHQLRQTRQQDSGVLLSTAVAKADALDSRLRPTQAAKTGAVCLACPLPCTRHSTSVLSLVFTVLPSCRALPQGAATYLSVYYAKKQHDTVNDKESCPARNAKLYFCGTPAGLRRDSILALFSAFGRVRHLQVYTDSYGVLSSGTVTMYSTDEAIAAMDSLDGKVLQSGTAPLKVGRGLLGGGQHVRASCIHHPTLFPAVCQGPWPGSTTLACTPDDLRVVPGAAAQALLLHALPCCPCPPAAHR